MNKSRSNWRDFFKDAQNRFNIFTLIAMLAGITLVTSPLVCRLAGWDVMTYNELTTLTLIYCISALSDYLLAIYINKIPNLVGSADTVNIDTTVPGMEEKPIDDECTSTL